MVNKLASVQNLANTSKLGRLLRRPFRYVHAIGFREWSYKRHRKAKAVTCKTFFGASMTILLPASTDIYLTGGKSHDSEIRLAKLLIRQLGPGDVFIDVGAHYGYFTLLGAHLVGKAGEVHAFEASPTTFKVLQRNVAKYSAITAHNVAVSNAAEVKRFNEFPNLYAEYNALDVKRHRGEAWFKDYAPRQVEVDGITLGSYIKKHSLSPKVIKVDVEGAELQVAQGLRDTLQDQSAMVVLEYIATDTGNASHRAADDVMRSMGYLPHAITDTGDLLAVHNINAYLQELGIESDNVVFVRKP